MRCWIIDWVFGKKAGKKIPASPAQPAIKDLGDSQDESQLLEGGGVLTFGFYGVRQPAGYQAGAHRLV